MREESKTHMYKNACVHIYMEIDISSHKTSLVNNVKLIISLFMVFINMNNMVYMLLKICLSHCIWVFYMPVRLYHVWTEDLGARKRCEIICNYSYELSGAMWVLGREPRSSGKATCTV